MSARLVLFIILGFDALWFALQIDGLSISYDEAALLGGDISFLQLLVDLLFEIFGKNDFTLRMPMITFHILSALLLYSISREYVKLERNRLWLVLIFLLLPGAISSAIVVNSAGVLLFGAFLFVHVYKNYHIKYSYLLLIFYMFIDSGFVGLFMALVLFSVYIDDKRFSIFNTALVIVSLLLYGIDTHGSPKGYFLDTIGIYAAIFSPIIFVYLFYVLYRKYLTKELELLWFIATVPLVFSLLLSFRQRVAVEDFAPFVFLALPLIAQVFEHSYRVRLNIFRKRYKFAFAASLIILLINSCMVFFNKYLYIIIDEPKKHFSYKMHVAKELSEELKNRGVECIKSDEKMVQRLEFYGVTNCNKYLLEEKKSDLIKNNYVTISYKNIPIYSANVTKINKN